MGQDMIPNMMSNPMPKKKVTAVIEMTELSLASTTRPIAQIDIVKVKEDNQKLKLALVELRDEMEAKMEARFEKLQQQMNELMDKNSSNSAEVVEIEIIADENGRRYSYNHGSGESTWVDEE